MSALITPDWLASVLGQPNVKILDASWYLPAQNRDPEAEFLAAHIPGAVRFDIDVVSDQSSDLPHTMPSAEQFSRQASALGLSNDDTIIVYDGIGLFSAPRVWWMLRVFGARDVRLLDGGFPAWQRAGLPVETGPSTPSEGHFVAALSADHVKSVDDVRNALAGGTTNVVDARARNRFTGEAPEPRPQVKSGHMPGARNVPFTELLDDSGALRAAEEVRQVFEEAGLDFQRPVITSCGSGVTAAVLLLALSEIGKTDVTVYDGSWSEWGTRNDTDVVTGEA